MKIDVSALSDFHLAKELSLLSEVIATVFSFYDYIA